MFGLLSSIITACYHRCVSGDLSNPVESIDDIDINMVANFCEIFAQVGSLEYDVYCT